MSDMILPEDSSLRVLFELYLVVPNSIWRDTEDFVSAEGSFRAIQALTEIHDLLKNPGVDELSERILREHSCCWLFYSPVLTLRIVASLLANLLDIGRRADRHEEHMLAVQASKGVMQEIKDGLPRIESQFGVILARYRYKDFTQQRIRDLSADVLGCQVELSMWEKVVAKPYYDGELFPAAFEKFQRSLAGLKKEYDTMAAMLAQ